MRTWEPSPIAKATGGEDVRPDSRYLSIGHSGGPRIRVYEISPDTEAITRITPLPSIAGDGRGTGSSPDGRFVALAHYNGNNVTVLRTSNWTAVNTGVNLPGTGWNVMFTRDSKFMITSHDGGRRYTISPVSWS